MRSKDSFQLNDIEQNMQKEVFMVFYALTDIAHINNTVCIYYIIWRCLRIT